MNLLKDLAKVTIMESQIVIFKLLFIAIAFGFRFLPNTKLFGHLTLRKLVSAVIGFASLWYLLSLRDMCLMNFFCVLHYLLVKHKALDESGRFWVMTSGLVLGAFVKLENMLNHYGERYPSHLDLLAMMMVLRFFYYTWECGFVPHVDGRAPGKGSEGLGEETSGEGSEGLGEESSGKGSDRLLKESSEKACLEEESSAAREMGQMSLLEMICYCYSFPGLLTGPVLSYQEYSYFIKNDAKLRYKFSMFELMRELVLMGLSLFVILFEKRFYDKTEILSINFSKNPFWYKMFYCYTYFFLYRFRIVFVKTLSHVQYIILGIQQVKKGKLGGLCRGCDLYTIEFSNTFRDRVGAWSIPINRMLRKYVYLPVIGLYGFSKGNASSLTFLYSAVWHGFYPNYYISFVFFQLTILTERALYKLRGDLPRGVRYWGMRFMNLAMGGGAMIFPIRDWQNLKMVLRNTSPLLLSILGGYLVSSVLVMVIKPGSKKKKGVGDKVKIE